MPTGLALVLLANLAPAKTCAPNFELNFKRARPVDARAIGLKIQLGDVAWRNDQATAAVAALVASPHLETSSAAEQTRAFARLFERADLAEIAGETDQGIDQLVRRALATHAPSLTAAVDHSLGDPAPLLARARANARGLLPQLLRDVVRVEERLTRDGEIAHDPVSGAPDRVTYELIKTLERQAPALRTLPRRERSRVERVFASRRRAYAVAWEHPHYATLETIRYTEPVPNGYVDRPVRDFVENARHRHSFWWESFGRFAELLDLARGRPRSPPARITGESSRSPLRYLFGANAEREIFWPAVRKGAEVTPDLTRLRVNETRLNGRVEAVELLVNERAGDPPRGYLFIDMGGDLVPALRFNGRFVREACARCHAEAFESPRASFNPFALKTKDDYLRVGYRGEEIIEALLANVTQ